MYTQTATVATLPYCAVDGVTAASRVRNGHYRRKGSTRRRRCTRRRSRRRPRSPRTRCCCCCCCCCCPRKRRRSPAAVRTRRAVQRGREPLHRTVLLVKEVQLVGALDDEARHLQRRADDVCRQTLHGPRVVPDAVHEHGVVRRSPAAATSDASGTRGLGSVERGQTARGHVPDAAGGSRRPDASGTRTPWGG